MTTDPDVPTVTTIDWQQVAADLDRFGCAVVPGLVSPEDCADLRNRYADEAVFRARVVMARHGFGQGEYKYFADPVPPLVAGLRRGLYPPLTVIANDWMALMGEAARYPADHDAFRAECLAAGQSRPTPLLLKYGPGDYNCLHQDLYGDLVFPVQVAVLLSRPGEDFTGGAFVLTEQRPRMQSRAEVVSMGQGDAVVFPVRQRPCQGRRGTYRVTMRHGVSRVITGERFTLGVIFHDAA